MARTLAAGRDAARSGRGDENGAVTDAADRAPRPWIAAVADLAVVVVFVVIGRRSHHEDAGFVGFLRVWWPFAIGLGIAWAVTGLRHAPLAWRRVAAGWLVTVGAGMILRVVVEGHDLSIAFTIVTLLFVGAGMFGWRGGLRVVRARRAATSSA
jgi:Protein of unknown function (DUF3054)